MPLDEFIDIMKTQLPAYQRSLEQELLQKISRDDWYLWCLANNLPIDW
jgi:hypothetical protein